MSAAEATYMMNDTRDDYDLPRWQTHLDPLQVSSSTQAAQSAQGSYYPNPIPPPPTSATLPPNSPHRGNQPSQSQGGSSRQPRIAHIIDQEPQPMSLAPSFVSPNQLSRSSSLSTSTTANSSARSRRHHQPEDLQVNFNDGSPLSPQRHLQQSGQPSFYSPSLGYQPSSLADPSAPANTPSAATGEPYSEMYFSGSHPPKREQNSLNTASTPTAGAPPLRGVNPNSAVMIDAYSQSAPYSPTTGPYSPYPPNDQRPPASAGYQSHNRGQVQAKAEPMTPSMGPQYNTQTPYSSVSYSMDTSSSPHPPPQLHTLSTPHVPMRKTASSSPSTPMSYMHSPHSQSSYYPQDQPMVVDVPTKRRATGFHRVRTSHDLQPRLDYQPQARRMGADGTFLSPLRQLTTHLVETYHICNPQFRYESTHNPRRVLTKPSKPMHNEGFDNEDYDYILYVNDWLGTEEGHKYLILDILGQGTFGQVVKCQNMKTHEIVAVKVVKNKPAYFNQSMMEVTILELLNKNCDPGDEHHILRLRDSFIHKNHLCLVFELLSSNLYELIKQNQFQGLSTQLVKVFMAQLLDALTILKDARLIHCDLKPENILLKSLQSPQIKVIDFGSACHERQTVYTYIQSRFYRSPEVLLGMPYTAAIDMWSLGCIAVELFLGLPLFPGTSEYNQITRIVEMLGMPPLSMLNTGKQTNQFFDTYESWNPRINQNETKYRLKSLEQYSREHNTNEQPGKQYFKATTLPEIVNTAPMPTSKSSRSSHEVEKELNNRASFIDFCQGLLDMNPMTRWTPQQARLHPFITGEKFVKPFVPDGMAPLPATGSTDPKRPYGGLVPSQPKGARAYQDAAAYNQHLSQHQVYTAQAQSQAANTFRNPYMAPQTSQGPPPSSYTAPSADSTPPYPQPQTYQPPAGAATAPPTQRLNHQNSHGQLSSGSNMTQFSTQSQGSTAHLNTNVSSNQFYSGSQRARSNTMNQQLDAIPPALARLQHMNQDVIAGRNALTPVLNREDAMREWERRQSGKASTAQPYPQLEFLQQQAELASSGLTNWVGSNRYQQPPSKLSHSYNAQPMEEDKRRDAVLSNVRSAARNDPTGNIYGSANVMPSQSQSYTGASTNRYNAGYAQQQQPPTSHFDSVDRRNDIGNIYVPIQPDQYGTYNSGSSTRHMGTSQAVGPSFYGAGIVPSGQQQSGVPHRNPFDAPPQGANNTNTDNRRGSGVDAWATGR